jgi:hypothetical protein
MLHRTVLCFLGAGLMAGAFFAAESLHAQAVQECFRILLRQRQDKCPGHTDGIGFTADLAIVIQANSQSITIDPQGATDISQVAITLMRM